MVNVTGVDGITTGVELVTPPEPPQPAIERERKAKPAMRTYTEDMEVPFTAIYLALPDRQEHPF
jgi:hypothetical protein